MAARSCLDDETAWALAHGQLGKQETQLAREHLDVCEPCRTLVGSLAPDRPNEEPLFAGRFRLEGRAGTGATGTVYRAHDTLLGATVALKVAPAGSATHLDTLRRELISARRIQHPNVCRVFDIETEGDSYFATMEWIDGESLDTRIRRGPFTMQEATHLLEQVASGLESVHEQGIVHRDLKPSNILLEAKTGRALLCDFGLSMDLDSEESRAKLVGTPMFWSPEQGRGERASKASDVYSFGVVAYRLFAGVDWQMSHPAWERVPFSYRAILRRCVASDPQMRYPDGASLRRAFRRASRMEPSRTVFAGAFAGLVAVAFMAWWTLRSSAIPERTSVGGAALAPAEDQAPPVASVPTAAGQAESAQPTRSPPSLAASAKVSLSTSSTRAATATTRPSPGRAPDASATPSSSAPPSSDDQGLLYAP